MTIGRRAIGERARTFAARVASRHGRARGVDAPMTRVFARLVSPTRPSSRVRHHHTHLRVEPRFTLSLTQLSARMGWVDGLRRRELATAVTTRHTSHVERIERTRRELADRVVARNVRREGQRIPAPERISTAAPVPRMLRKPAPLVELEEKPVPRPLPVSAPAPRAPLSAHEVSQLTDTVIRSLDRRLSAARERRGHS